MTASVPALKPQLVFVRDGMRHAVSLDQEYTFIGQGPDNDVQLKTDNSVSRRHAVVTPIGSQYYLCDLVSDNGTKVNGQRITRLVPLSQGDEIVLGTTKLVFDYTSSGFAQIMAPASVALH